LIRRGRLSIPAFLATKLVRAAATDYNGGSQEIRSLRKTELACPYFMPVTRLENGSWPHPARLPLGCGWSGHCTAPGHEEATPSQDILEAFCNLGYATGCAWSPRQPQWDAVRFAVTAPAEDKGRDKQSAEFGARVLRLLYVCERDHRPVVRGELEFDLSAARWLCRHEDPRIQRMAECFLESYLKLKS
jgi:hypothetical protein